MASKRPDASTTLRQIAFERLFNPSLSYTRPILRSNCTLPTDLSRDMFTEEIRLLDCFLEHFLYVRWINILYVRTIFLQVFVKKWRFAIPDVIRDIF